jgi:hypothetical protein
MYTILYSYSCLYSYLQSTVPTVCGTGLAASTGAACGAIVFTNEAARAAYDRGEEVILCRHETSPEDILGISLLFHVWNVLLIYC